MSSCISQISSFKSVFGWVSENDWVSDNDWWLTVPDTVLDTWLCPGSSLVSPGPGY